MPDYPKPPYPNQRQPMPGLTAKMDPRPDHGETSYKGSGRLKGKHAIVTGGDSGIGRAVAIAFAREGADIVIAYLDETEDAKEVADLIEREGRKAVLVSGDLRSADHCRAVVDRAFQVFVYQAAAFHADARGHRMMHRRAQGFEIVRQGVHAGCGGQAGGAGPWSARRPGSPGRAACGHGR